MKPCNFPGRKYQRRMKVLQSLEMKPEGQRTVKELIIMDNLYRKTAMSFQQAINIQTKKFGGKTGRKTNHNL